MTQKEKTEVVRLIKTSCANYVDGNCIALANQPPCVQLNSSISMGEGRFLCRYCRDVVLAVDKDLYAKLVGRVAVKQCASCGKNFVPNSNRAKYCDACAQKMKKKQTADCMRRKRAKA